MAHHAQCLCRVAGDQDALALGEQAADKIADGVSFSRAWRALHQNTPMFFELPGNADLLGIGGLAEEHFTVLLSRAARRSIRISCVGNRRFFSHDVQERPGKILAPAQVFEDALDRRGEP